VGIGALATLGFYGASFLFRKVSLDEQIPFGPGLCAAGFIVLCARLNFF